MVLLTRKERSMLPGEQLTLPLTYILVPPPDHLRFQRGSPQVPSSFSVELLLILLSPSWCHLLCEAFPGCLPPSLCSQPLSTCHITSLHCLVRQLALSFVAPCLLSASQGQGSLACWIEGGEQARVALRKEIGRGILVEGVPTWLQ